MGASGIGKAAAIFAGLLIVLPALAQEAAEISNAVQAADGGRPGTASDLRVQIPSGEIALWEDQRIPIWISVGEPGAADVAVVAASLTEEGSHLTSARGWELCQPLDADVCAKQIALSAHATHALALRAVEPHYKVGRYTGWIEIGHGAQEPVSLELRYARTGFWPRARGIVLILLGAGFAYGIIEVANNRRNRAEMLRPLVAIEERRVALEKRLRALKDVFPWIEPIHTRRFLERLETRLKPSVLSDAGFLPDHRSFDPRAARGDESVLKEYTAKIGAWLDVADLLMGAYAVIAEAGIDQGAKALKVSTLDAEMQPAASAGSGDLPPLDMAAVQAALAGALDDLAGTHIATDPSTRPLSGRLISLQGRSGGLLIVADTLPTRQALELEITRLSLLQVSAYLLLTTLVGFYFLILQNPGFGTGRDLFECLLWGVGLPAGTQLLNQTPTTLRTTLRLDT